MKDLLIKAFKFLENNQLNEAEKLYLRILEKENLNFDANLYLGTIFLIKKNYLDSIFYLEKSLKIKKHPLAYNNLGLCFYNMGDLIKAINYYEKALEIDPLYNDSVNNKAIILKKQKKNNELKILLEDFLKKKEGDYKILNLYGLVLCELKKYDEAINFFDKSIEKNRSFLDPYINIGAALVKKGNFLKALDIFLERLSEFNNNLDLFYNISITYFNLEDYDKSLLYAHKVLNLNKNHINALKIILHTYVILDDASSAKKYYDKIYSIINNSNLHEIDTVLGLLIRLKIEFCEWDNLDKDLEILKQLNNSNLNNGYPGYYAYILDEPEILKHNAINYAQEETIVVKNISFQKKKKSKKINVAYVSGDFRCHAMMDLMKDIFKNHDKEKFNIFAFYTTNLEDSTTREIKPYFTKFYNIANSDAEDVLKTFLLEQIDIAVDLSGYTKYGKSKLFFNRLASKQINFLGYPGTMGHHNYDYIISDKFIIPENYKNFYTEKVIYMPNIYQPNSFNLKETSFDFKKQDKKDKFVFSALHRSTKVNPKIFSCWVEILKKTPNSKIIIGPYKEFYKENLINFCKKNNIELTKFEFTKKLNQNEHYERIRSIDLGLDSYPYNGHTTTGEFLKNITPVLTLCGKSFQSRVSASLLKYFSLDDLITYSYKDYIDKAIEIYNNKSLLEEYKLKITNALNNGLFNIKKFTKDLEDIYDRL